MCKFSFGTFRRLLIIPLFVLGTIHAQAQTDAGKGRITGRVANSATGLYLEGATVRIKDTAVATLTDSSGRFTLTALDAGNYTISVSYIGLDTLEEKISLQAGQTVDREIALNSEIYELATFTVVGEREGNAKAMTLQKNAENIRNIVDAEAFGTVADGNVGDFAKLLPGVNAEGKNGETWALRIRGSDPSLNSVTVDGFKTAGATLDADSSRTFDVGVTPIEGISTLELTKSPTPSQPADSIGGSINLISRSALDQQYNGPAFSVAGGAIARSYRNKLAYNGQLRFQDQYAVGSDTRNVAVSFTLSSNDNYIPNNRVEQTWNVSNGAITGLNSLRVFEARIDRRRGGSTLNVDYKFSPTTTIKLRTAVDFFNQKSYENYVEWNATRARAQNWAYWKKRESNNVGLIFEHDLGGWKIDYGAQLGRSISDNFDTGFGRNGGRLQWDNRSASTFAFDLPSATGREFTSVRQVTGPDFRDPGNWVLINNGQRIRNINFNKSTINAKLNVAKTFELFGKFPVRTQNGLNFTEETLKKIHDEKVYTIVGADGVRNNSADELIMPAFTSYTAPQDRYPLYGGEVLVNGQPYAPLWLDNAIVNQHRANNPNLWTRTGQSTTYDYTSWYNAYVRNKFTLTEGVLAAYTQYSVNIGKLNVLTGVRYEDTQVSRRGHSRVNGAYEPFRRRKSSSYDDFFPSIHTKYSITSNLIARASYSQTIGRPSISTLLQEEDFDYGTRRITAANLGIKPQTADNLDLVLEYYFEPVGVVSVNYFQKSIKNFIESYNYDIIDASTDVDDYGPEFYYTPADQANGLLPWRVSGRRNSGSGKIRGVEFAYQQQFSFLPGPLKRLSGFANYTYIETESQKGGTSESGSLTNFVPELLNVGLSWRGHGFDVKLRYNWTDDYLREDSAIPINRVYNAATGRYDLNLSYSVSRNVSVYFDIFNMFNSHEQFYQGGAEVGQPIYLRRDEDNGTRYSFGARIRL